jgi:hypothetical protein
MAPTLTLFIAEYAAFYAVSDRKRRWSPEFQLAEA